MGLKVAVLGAGVMGHALALVHALGGCRHGRQPSAPGGGPTSSSATPEHRPRAPIPPEGLDAMTDAFSERPLATDLLAPFRCIGAAADALSAAEGAVRKRGPARRDLRQHARLRRTP